MIILMKAWGTNCKKAIAGGFLLLLGFCVGQAAISETSAQKDGVSLKVAISPDKPTGEVRCTISVTNQTSLPVFFIIAYADHPDFEMEILNAERKPVPLTEDGRRVSHKGEKIHGYTRHFGRQLKPQAQTNWVVDLKGYFELQPGRYFLSMDFPVNDDYYALANTNSIRQDAYFLHIKELPFEVP